MASRKKRSQATPTVRKRVVKLIPIVDEDDDEESSDSESDGDGAAASGVNSTQAGRGRASQSQGPTPSASKKVSKKINIRSGVTLTLDEMVQNCLYSFLINQQKKLPVKRSDLIKNAMNGQRQEFEEVMEKLEQVAMDVFGMRIVGLEKSKSGEWTSYIIISVFDTDLAHSVTLAMTLKSDSKRAILFILLSVMFMLNRSIDEDMIWKILEEMSLDQLACKKKEDLRKFLKSEYVTTMYLLEEITDTDNAIVRYFWGPRSELEFSKHAMLKFVAKQFPGKQIRDFPVQYSKVMETERELVEAELEELHLPDGENGSALADLNGHEFSIPSQDSGMEVENNKVTRAAEESEEESEADSD